MQVVFQVSEFIEVLNHHLSLLGEVVVEGELFRWDVKNGRLLFGAIKDASSSIDIFSLPHLVRNYRQFEPGMLVHAVGSPGLYKGSGKFRLMVTQLIPQGEGALQIAFDRLKLQLESEGLFAPDRKRPLPLWPRSIGLITAAGSSAFYDMHKILNARMPNVSLKLLPVTVQGRFAIPSILKALQYCQDHPHDFDLLIIGRGGGSLEDLQAFNSEEVCRAMYSLKIPVISAVGHEDNWSLTDYVADARASTPSNAAEIAVRDHRDVEHELDTKVKHISHQISRSLESHHAMINRQVSTVKSTLANIQYRVTQTILSYNRCVKDVRRQIIEEKVRVEAMQLFLKQSLSQHLKVKTAALENLTRLIDSLDYRKVLHRGYSITKNNQGQILKQSSQVVPGDRVYTQLASGIFNAIVKGDE